MRFPALLLRTLAFCGALASWSFLAVAANAAEGSRCLAMAQAPMNAPVDGSAHGPPHVRPVRFTPAALGAEEVLITYVTHATFRIATAAGTTIATDYAGVAGRGRLPDVVTMNHAHETHYTDFPEKEIAHVLRGWNPAGGPARHNLNVGDVLIRNVPTDIRTWDGGREEHGNSIFIFEVAGLCIGHLGHLHHELSPEDLATIGQLDVVMAPVDGTFTLDQPSMVKTLKVLKARIVIPMHAFGASSLASFVQKMSADFAISYQDKSELNVTAAGLPETPTVMVLPETLHLSFE
ncbi:MAG: MBL fold metallo-hydrolase [Alphaproteobacteria bacterium]|nr:MBL fold metallo-hydrolase [Alphaproteobacteria bacterium]